MGNTKNSLKYDIKKLNPYESPFNKQKCIELLNETCFSGSFLNNKTTTKLFTPKILTLEKFNLTHMLALKQYLEDILLTCPPEEYLAYKEQLNVISKILTLDDKAYYYMETGFFHRVMAYGYTFPGEIGRLYSFSSSMPRLKREVRYLIFKNIYKDVDIENAHPSILLEYALSKNLKTLKLEQLVRDRSLFYQTVSEDLKCSISDVKIIVLKCLNQIPKEFYNGPFSKILTDLFEEILVIRNFLWEENYKNMKFFLSTKTNFEKKSLEKKKVTVLSIYCQTRESEILLDLYSFLKVSCNDTDEKPALQFIPFFDGAYICFFNITHQKLLDEWLKEYNQKHQFIKFKIKNIESDSRLLLEDTFKSFCIINDSFKKLSYKESQDLLKAIHLEKEVLTKNNLQLLIKYSNNLKNIHDDFTKNIDVLKKEIKVKKNKGTDEDLLKLERDLKELQQNRLSTYQLIIPTDLEKELKINVQNNMCLLRKNLIDYTQGNYELSFYIKNTIARMHSLESLNKDTEKELVDDRFLEEGIPTLISQDPISDIEV